MKKSGLRWILGLFLSAGLFVSLAQAELGLQQILSDQGVEAVGAMVRSASEAIFAGDDPEQIQSQLVAILNEAAATEDEAAMRYAMVAVLMGNLTLGRDAINNSDISSNHPELANSTVTYVEKLNAPKKPKGGGKKEDGGSSGGDSGSQLGGGTPNPFDPSSLEEDVTHDDIAPPFGRIDDRDSAATRI